MKRLILIPLIFVLCSCAYLQPVVDAVDPYVDMIKPTSDEEMESMADLIVNVIRAEANKKEISGIKELLTKVNNSLRPEENAVTFPKIFAIPGLSEKNKARIGIAINAFELKYGKAAIKTPEKYQWILKLIANVHDKL